MKRYKVCSQSEITQPHSQLEFHPRLFIHLLVLIAGLVCPEPATAQEKKDSTLVNTGSPDSSETRYRKVHKASFDAEVTYSARDSIKILVQEKMIFLYGDAVVHYKDLEIKAARVAINFETNVMTATPLIDSVGSKTGIPHFKDNQDEMTADSFQYSFKSKKGIIYGLITEQADGLVYGEKVKKDDEDNLYIRNARYTTCNDTAHPHFYIQAGRMKMIPDDKIVSGPAVFYVADVPTIGMLPFGYFPITKGRKSGIIMPNYGYSRSRGYFLRNGGYYFGLSDYFDLALTGDIYANLSWRGQASSYYAKRYKYSGNMTMSYAVNKDNEREDPDYSEGRDFLFTWNHVMDNRARPKTNFSANVQLGSSNYLRLNSYNPNDIVTNTMNSGINYSRSFGIGNVTAAARHTQNTNTGNVNVTLPDVRFDVYRFFPFRGDNYSSSRSKWYQDIGVTYTNTFRNQLSTGDSTFFTPESLEALQYGLQQNMATSGNFKLLKFLAFSPSASYTEYWYFQSINQEYIVSGDSVRIDTVPGFVRGYEYNFSASLSTILYGMYRFNGKKINALRHVMTPTVSLSYRPDFGEEKYGFYKKVATDGKDSSFQTYSIFANGIFGGPGQGKYGVVNFSLGNNFEMKVRDEKDTATGFRKIKLVEVFNIASSYNLLVDSNNLAPIAIDLRTTLFKYIGFQLSTTFNTYGFNELGNTTKEWLYNQNRKIMRLVSSRIYITTSLNSETLKGKPTPGRMRPYVHPYMTSQELLYLNSPDQFVDFNIPWNFNLNYVYNHNRSNPYRYTEVQTLNFSGDFSLTQKWKIGFNSGYDFGQKNLSMTTFNLYRDLHCWEFRFDWMPFGDRRYFAFALNAKSSVLQDLKLNRRRDWYDR